MGAAQGLELVVDYGWLTMIAAPLFWVLEWFFLWTGNWGIAIILLTVVIKLIFYPLSAASYKSMAKMKVVAPKLARLREMYPDDRMKQNQAMMELGATVCTKHQPRCEACPVRAFCAGTDLGELQGLTLDERRRVPDLVLAEAAGKALRRHELEVVERRVVLGVLVILASHHRRDGQIDEGRAVLTLVASTLEKGVFDEVRSVLRENGAAVHTYLSRDYGHWGPMQEGPAYDLPIAVGILISSEQAPPPPEPSLFLGELSLDGTVRPTTGVLPMVALAQAEGIGVVVEERHIVRECHRFARKVRSWCKRWCKRRLFVCCK